MLPVDRYRTLSSGWRVKRAVDRLSPCCKAVSCPRMLHSTLYARLEAGEMDFTIAKYNDIYSTTPTR